MRCATALATYTCSNSGGTTCTKVAVSVPSITTATTCPAASLILLTQAEYDALVSKDSTLAAAVTAAGTSAVNANALAGTANASANTALAEIAKGLTLKVLPYEATSDDYSAITGIFAVALAAGAVIWGMKRILKLLNNPSEA